MYFKINKFHYITILFSEKNYKKQAKHKYFSKSFISVTYSWDIVQFGFKKSMGLNLKNLGLPYWARINVIYIGVGLEEHLD